MDNLKALVACLAAVIGLAMIVLGVLVWLGVIKLPQPVKALEQAGPWDFFFALLNKAPWVAGVGIVLFLVGIISC